MSTVLLPDIPREPQVALPGASTAVVVVDMQNDFAHERGALFGEGARDAIPVIRELLSRARAAGARVVFTQDWHDEDDPEFEVWGEHARAGTWGAEIVDGLQPQPGDIRVHKLRYDAFYGTSLDHRLRVAGIRQLVVVGTVANICVLHTAGSAALRHYQVVVPDDAVAALTEFDKAATLRQVTFLYRGVVTSAAGVRFT
jgi:nicotinamidase-related amidase